MFIHNSRTSAPGSAGRPRLVDEARDWANSTIGLICARTGCARSQAITWLARSAQVQPGTLENLSRERLKRLAAEDFIAIREAFVAEINRHIGILEAELKMARARGTTDSAQSAHISAAYAAIEQAKAALKKAAG